MFVAINYITCHEDYKERFRDLFDTRAREIDKMPGFVSMNVLEPTDGKSDFLVISYWESENNFKNWTHSEAFIEGHKRGFADIEKAKKEGKEPPMKSSFKTYEVIAD
ncbi:antibiotic biosynthesis monooxygenase family protein [Aureivirga sp. CE67]|uniref:antibiotic biosynthesis monooxygenase family protein n=1 Tax=Aureivirga sp. CE67 TaxID=1788983 RepID=UPI0018CA1529|nr:antibiotic biosynthesis monooxygenase [Aureivirga sp. CE67]